MLCGLLSATGIAGKPESYFRLLDERSYAESWGVTTGPGGSLDYWEYSRAAVAAGSTPNGVFAARVMWGRMDEVVTGLRSVGPHRLGNDLEVLQWAFGRTRFVHLQRRDVLAQGVSWARAEQTGHWQDRDGTTPCPGPQFDFDEVDRYVKAVNEHNAAWREWFASSTITPLVVFYEGLVADMPRTTATVLRFLGLEVPVGHEVVPSTRRQADAVNRQWVERYRSHNPFGP